VDGEVQRSFQAVLHQEGDPERAFPVVAREELPGSGYLCPVFPGKRRSEAEDATSSGTLVSNAPPAASVARGTGVRGQGATDGGRERALSCPGVPGDTAWGCSSSRPFEMAHQGAGEEKILRHYYTGVELASVADLS
jgi:hypothetical protein